MKGFAGATLDEATITVPMTLHVTGFSPSPSPQYKGFPTIHFDSKRVSSNAMGGAGWLGDGDGEEDVRRVKGTVTVCGDGSIWWSMVRPFSLTSLWGGFELVGVWPAVVSAEHR